MSGGMNPSAQAGRSQDLAEFCDDATDELHGRPGSELGLYSKVSWTTYCCCCQSDGANRLWMQIIKAIDYVERPLGRKEVECQRRYHEWRPE